MARPGRSQRASGPNQDGGPRIRRRWRDYATPAGHRPVRDFVLSLSSSDAAEVLAAMAEVAEAGLAATRHLRDEIYEVRAWGEHQTYRILFAPEGRYGQVLLALEGFSKKTQKTPEDRIELALHRLRDWRARGAQMRGEPLSR